MYTVHPKQPICNQQKSTMPIFLIFRKKIIIFVLNCILHLFLHLTGKLIYFLNIQIQVQTQIMSYPMTTGKFFIYLFFLFFFYVCTRVQTATYKMLF